MVSHPSRVRVLKYHEALDDDALDFTSHPSRVRGLKLRRIDNEGQVSHVAPFTGACIEIQCCL